MTIVIACPTCQSKIRAPDNVAGRQIKCPQCKTPFTATEAPTSGPVAMAPPPPAPVAIAAHARPATAVVAAPAPDPLAFDLPPGPAVAFGFDEPTAPPLTGADSPAEKARQKLRAANQAGGIKGYLLFQKMVTPVITTGLFYVGVLLIILGTLGGIAFTLLASHLPTLYALIACVVAFVSALVYLVIWRIVCELWVVVFRISETLTDIKALAEEARERRL